MVQGFVITIGEPDIHAALEHRDLVDLSVPVTMKASEVLRESLVETARSFGGASREASYEGFRNLSRRAIITRAGEDFETVSHLQKRVANMVFVLELTLDDGKVQACHVSPEFSMDGIPGYFGFLPLAPVSYLLSDTIFSLGRSTFRDKRLESDEGFVAVFEEPIAFTPALALKLEEAKRVKAVRGLVVEGTLEEFHHTPTLPGSNPCRIQK